MQATFFIALAVASRMGTAALAAHQIVAQLWLLTSYVTDGFAVAGTVLGSRLSHERHDPANSGDKRYRKTLSAAGCAQITSTIDCVYVVDISAILRALGIKQTGCIA